VPTCPAPEVVPGGGGVGGALQLVMNFLVVPLTFGKLEPFLVDVPSMLCPRFVKKQDHFLHCVPTCSAPDVVPGVGGDALDDPGLEEEVSLLLELVGSRHRAPHRDRVLPWHKTQDTYFRTDKKIFPTHI
jgi:hypothetical protein